MSLGSQPTSSLTLEDAREIAAEEVGRVFVLPDTAPFDDYQLVAVRGRWAVFESRRGGVRQVPVQSFVQWLSRSGGVR